MLKLNKTNESGRSMVEMLGVLAIIGVLSVMGIAGYTVAMSTHHANEVLNQVNRMAILISAQRQLNGGVGSPTSEDTPYSVELDQSNTSKIVLTASNVPAGAAKRLEGMTLSVPEISVSGTTVTFTFENDLGEGGTGAEEEEDYVDECNPSNVGKKACSSYDSYYYKTECVCDGSDCIFDAIFGDEWHYSDDKCKTKIPFDCTNPSGYNGGKDFPAGETCTCNGTTGEWDCEFVGE